MDNFNFKNQGFIYSWGDFKSKRYYGLHEGLDFSNVKKGEAVFAEIAGVLDFKGFVKGYGNLLRIKTDLFYKNKNLKGIIIYSEYGHLFDFEQFNANYIPKNHKIGKIGASGACQYFDKIEKKWKFVSLNDQKNIYDNKGVHLHFDIYINNNEKTEDFLQNIINTLNINEKDLILKQWGKIYLNPKHFLNYYYNFIEKEENNGV